MTSDTTPNALPQDSSALDLENTKVMALLAEIEQLKDCFQQILLKEKNDYDSLNKSYGGTD